jgi:hypothetical protein
VGRLSDLFSKRSVDDRLLSGELSPDSGKGRARAEQLVSRRYREKTAKALMDLIEEGQQDHPSFFNANLRIQRDAVRKNSARILRLARDLQELEVVDPRGVILADRLIEDGESPVYAFPYEDEGAIERALERARAALKAS